MAPHLKNAVDKIVARADWPVCGGTRHNQAALDCRINGKNIADCAAMQVSDLAPFVHSIEEPTLAPMISALAARLENLRRGRAEMGALDASFALE